MTNRMSFINWQCCNVNDIALKIQYGYTGKVVNSGSHFYLRITDIQNGKVNWSSVPFCDCSDKDIPNYELKTGDILFARTGGTVGKSFLFAENVNSIFASYLIRIIPDTQKVNSKFLYLFFQSPLYWIQIRDAELGSAQPNVNGTKLANIKLFLPPLPEQHRIVAKLDALFERIDKAIELVKENIIVSENLIASVLDDVFGDGDTPLGELCIINPKKSEVASCDKSMVVSFLPMTDLKEHKIYFEAIQQIKLQDAYSGYTYFKDGDVLLAKVTPCFENGKAGIATNLRNKIGFGSSEFHVLRPTKDVMPEWIYFSVMTASFKKEGVRNFTGSSGLKRVPAKFLSDWKIKFLPRKEQQATIDKIISLSTKSFLMTEKLHSKLIYLKALKASLLDRTFKGEL